ncbi:MAG TPA: hypothetical protein VGO04_03110 [Ensifer sp.]|jgi:hypothetical protein|uniref:hypothetical protein n=1 Tax=Ensifer sp. TaxID=1872086 RepID=UPI002E15E2F1|nr:hypothetical protein [Ensifer sp.]
MKNTLAAALVATVALGGASAAVAGGGHEAVGFAPAITGRAEASAGTGVSASSAERGNHAARLEHHSIDATATGAIAAGHAKLGEIDKDNQ